MLSSVLTVLIQSLEGFFFTTSNILCWSGDYASKNVESSCSSIITVEGLNSVDFLKNNHVKIRCGVMIDQANLGTECWSSELALMLCFSNEPWLINLTTFVDETTKWLCASTSQWLCLYQGMSGRPLYYLFLFEPLPVGSFPKGVAWVCAYLVYTWHDLPCAFFRSVWTDDRYALDKTSVFGALSCQLMPNILWKQVMWKWLNCLAWLWYTVFLKHKPCLSRL